MLIKQVQDLYELLDRPDASGEKVRELFLSFTGINVDVFTKKGENGDGTDYIKILIPGKDGKFSGGKSPTLGLIGRLGGLGARPQMNGFVSDGDGALSVLSSALKLADMKEKGDGTEGDVIVVTHIDPDAPTKPHHPVPFMKSAIDQKTKNEIEVDPNMDAILSVDTTKGNRILNHNGIAITPTIKEGYILRVSEDLLDVYQNVTGHLPFVLPITTQDITPYGNGVFHINSILQPACLAKVPVVGVAITAVSTIAGCATGATQFTSVEQSARFCVESAKSFGEGKLQFYNQEEYQQLLRLYGSMSVLQKELVL